MRLVSSVVLSLVFGSAAFAGSPAVGQPAPDFSGTAWVMNDPGQVSMEDLRGDVVFVEKWGVNCGPCLRLIPHVQSLQEEYGERGLHIFAFEAQGHSAQETADTVRERGGRDYAVSAGGANNYQTDGGVPHGWLIGIDGTVIWQGNPGDANFDRILREEMAKVQFPGLGRQEFDRALRASLGKYMRQELGVAISEAQEVLDGRRSSDEAKADAEYLIARYERIAERRWAEAEQAEAARDYAQAAEGYTWFTRAFRRMERGEQAQARLDAFDDDPAIERELEAAERLARTLAQLEGRPAEQRQEVLRRFAEAEDYAGTRAAERALELSR
jgi:thiol-disulfide isomerase/thioredoxin/DNA-binding transcriptional MerR regulator